MSMPIENGLWFTSVIEADLAGGNNDTFALVVNTLRNKMSGEEDAVEPAPDIFELAQSDLVQVDVGIGTDKRYRLSLHRYASENLLSTGFDVWPVDQDGNPTGNTYGYVNDTGENTRATSLSGHYPESMDVIDFDVSPQQLAERLRDTFATLNSYNWQIVIGEKNVPEGEL
jgi:hypothetical protein